MVNLDIGQTNSSANQNKPLTDTQWREIQKTITNLENQKIAEAKAIYIHLKCTFGVEKCRDIYADRYHEVRKVIDEYTDKKLIDKQRNKLIGQILNHTYKEQAIQFAQQKFGIPIFKRLSLNELQQTLEYLEQLKKTETEETAETEPSAHELTNNMTESAIEEQHPVTIATTNLSQQETQPAKKGAIKKINPLLLMIAGIMMLTAVVFFILRP